MSTWVPDNVFADEPRDQDGRDLRCGGRPISYRDVWRCPVPIARAHAGAVEQGACTGAMSAFGRCGPSASRRRHEH